MCIKDEYRNGVFKPPLELSISVPGIKYQVLSGQELRQLGGNLSWLKSSERSFEFWENGEDAVYDRL